MHLKLLQIDQLKKTAEAIGDLIRNEIADAVAKSQNVSSKSITPV